MPEKWTGDVVGKMHVNCITYEELAAELGYSKPYVSMILNSTRHPKGIKQKVCKALDELIQQKN